MLVELYHKENSYTNTLINKLHVCIDLYNLRSGQINNTPIARKTEMN